MDYNKLSPKEKSRIENSIRKAIREGVFKEIGVIKDFERMIIEAVVKFIKNKFNFEANIVVKQQPNKSLIGDISLNSEAIKDHRFTLTVDTDQIYILVIQSLIHELIHIKQVVKGELKPSDDYKFIMWNGEKFISAKEYSKIKDYNKHKQLPWEQEAYDNMEPLSKEFLNSEYWNGMKGKNPTLDFIIDSMKY